MPPFINKNPHRIAVPFDEKNPEKLRRFRAGQVIEADGFLADQLKATAGVEQASAREARSWERHLAAERNPNATGGVPLHEVERDALGEADLLQHATIVAGTRRVVGDDQAPFGPGTGTITTKSAVGDRDHFGPNEAHPGDELEDVDPAEATKTGARVPTGAEVHNAQVRAAERAEAAARELVERSGPDAEEDPVPEDEPEPGDPADDDEDEQDEPDDDEPDDEPDEKPAPRKASAPRRSNAKSRQRRSRQGK